MPVNFTDLGVDFLVFSAHKCYGPLGLGFLVGKKKALEGLEPMETGGRMIREVHLDWASWVDVPHRFEAGTPNAAAAAAFPQAIDMLDEIGLEKVRAHERELAEYAIERLSTLSGLKILGPASAGKRGGLVSFHCPLVHPHDMATLLDQRGVAVRAGHHCAQPLHRKLGLAATTRASFGVYSVQSDVDALVDSIGFARRFFSS